VAVPAHPSLIVSLGVGALALWRLHGRVRRAIGRQQFSKGRARFTVFFFPAIAALLCYTTFKVPMGILGLVAGLAVGAGLGVYGLRLTKFENTPAGMFYTPNAHLGIALSSLLILRIGYRYVAMYFSADQLAAPAATLVPNPLTLLIFGTTAGYYTAYAIGLLRRKSVSQASPSQETS
jgi:hypothetical protein